MHVQPVHVHVRTEWVSSQGWLVQRRKDKPFCLKWDSTISVVLHTLASFPYPRGGGQKGLVSTVCALSVIRTPIHKGEGTNYVHMITCSGLWRFLFVYYLVHHQEDDGEMTTTTLPPATHFPGILSRQTETSGSKEYMLGTLWHLMAVPDTCELKVHVLPKPCR